MGLEKPDPSVVSTSSVGGDKSMLSLQTKSSYSIPDDGRAITIETNKRAHQKHQQQQQQQQQQQLQLQHLLQQQQPPQANSDAQSIVSQGSQASLLIEYFEGARGQGSSPGHRPSVRVKVTPSSGSQRRAHQQARAVEIGSDGRPINKRQPSYTQRISLSSARNDDRLAVAKERRKRRSDPSGSEAHSIPRTEEDIISEVSEQSQSLVGPPMRVEIIREENGSPAGAYRAGRPHSGAFRGRAIRKVAPQDDVDGDGDSSLHPLSHRRSQSLTNEREAILGEGSGKPVRKRSQSMDRGRLTKEEIREQRRLEKKMAELNGEPSTRRARAIRSPRDGRHHRSISDDGTKRKPSGSRNPSGTSDLAQNPLLLEAVEDAIKRLILPQFEALKVSNQSGNTTAIDQAASAAIAAEAARAFAEQNPGASFTPEREGPMLVLQPDADRGTGHGFVLAQSDNSALLRSESTRSRGLGFGPGPAPGSDLADDAPPVEPLDALFPKQASPHERLRMPSIPSMASSNRSDHEHIHDGHEGAPYPPTAAESGMPMTGNTPPPLSMPEAVAPLNISRRGTPASKEATSPQRSITSLRNQFETAGIIQIAPLATRKYTPAKSEVSVLSTSTVPSWHPNKSSHWTQDTVEARDLGMSSRSDLHEIRTPRNDAMNWWFEGNTEAQPRPDTEVDQSLVDQSVVDQSVVDQSVVGQSVLDQSVVGQSYADQSFADHSFADQSFADRSVVDQSVVGQSVADQSFVDRSVVGQSVADQSVVDHSAIGMDDDDHSQYQYGPDSEVGLNVPNGGGGSSVFSVPTNRDDVSSVTEIHRMQLDPPDATSNLGDGYESRSPNRDSVPQSFEARHMERIAAGQDVRDVGAYASMRSTPVDLPSQRASVYEHASSLRDQHSPMSLRPQDRALSPASTLNSNPPQMTFNAVPLYGYDEPAIGHYRSRSDLGPSELGDDDDVVTNPYGADRTSREIPMADDAITNPYTDNRLSRDMSMLSGVDDVTTNPYGADRTSRELDEGWGYGEDDHAGGNANFGLRALQAGQSGREYTGDQDSLMDKDGMLTPLNLQRDEGYMSAKPLSAGTDGLGSALKGMASFGAGLDDFISEDGDEFMPFRGHVRSGSGNSHGMPSPLYDSAMGHGIDRIQSKDIVALMDHLTVRDAARNARDTEILMTLVRSAAEMRDSFDDLKKQLANHSHQMMLEIDQGAEKTVAKLGAPRPVIPMPLSRQIKGPRNFEEEKAETHKKTNVFKRALKGLSMKSSSDLARIEDMLVQLLGEVEGLKAASYAYTESNTASHAGDRQIHTHSLHSQHSQPSYTAGSTNNITSVDYSATAGIGQRIMTSTGELNYYGARNPIIRQSSDIPQDIPNEDGMRTPRGHRDVQQDETPRRSGPTIETIQTPTEASPQAPRSNPQSGETTPTTGKGKEKRESLPKASRWSETTTSSGIKSFFGRKKRNTDAELSRANSEFEEDFRNVSPQAGPSEGSPYSQQSQRYAEPSYEKPSLEANRRSLEIRHPQPRVRKNHGYGLEQAAESHIDTQSPALTHSTTSLNRFIQHGGSYNNIVNLAPMFPDTDHAATPQGHYSPHQSPNGNYVSHIEDTHDAETVTPAPPLTANSEDSNDVSYVTERKKKHRHKKDETPEERAARKERRRQRQKSREVLGDIPQEADEDMMRSRPTSAMSRKYTRPLSAASHRSYRVADDGSTPASNRHRTSHLTHITTDTFGYQD
ncbi:hypothetical protein DRE_04076 [Drechslerella stenobrocha 248]|uniref:Uncharacterized protein n=1 Tax=Drechslerella stenobrocha 248 TaxID=1043628 RepID=W7HTB9_9PEZI|nr:hypothetical protein DRE_04076 [Drechslerella stenobrocha 248]